MAFLGSIGKAIGNIGKTVGQAIGNIGKTVGKVATGAGLGFLNTGSPWGAVAGGVAGLLGGGGGGGGGDFGGNDRIGVYVPPTTQEAYNIIKSLEGQVGNVSYSQYNIMKPYLDQAYSIFTRQPDVINSLFGNEENIIASRYANLFNNVKNEMQNQWSKSALGLSALGMYNTPATQLTQADIVSQLFGRIAESELRDLNALADNRVKALLAYYNNAPQVLAGFGETFAKLNPELDRFDRMLQLAGVLQGLSSSLIPYEKTSTLKLISDSFNEFIKNNRKDLPDFNQTMSSIFNGIGNVFGKIRGLFS